jgi:hypothetical protein
VSGFEPLLGRRSLGSSWLAQVARLHVFGLAGL